MTRILLITMTLAILVGCQQPDMSPSPGLGDPYPPPINNPDISVLDRGLQQWLAFQPAVRIRDSRTPLTVQVPVRNMADRAYLIEYRYLFYDANGLEQTPVMGWKFAKLEPKQVVNLSANAMDTSAVTYRLEVKWSR